MQECLLDASSLPKVLGMRITELLAAGFLGEREVTCRQCLRYLPGRRAVWLAECAEQTIVLKQYNPHPKQKRDASAEWLNAVRLYDADLSTPEPLFCAEADDGSLLVAFEFVPDGRTLEDVFLNPEGEDLHSSMQQLVQAHERQHELGCYQTDEHLGNYLWSRGKLWLLDAGTYRFQTGSLGEADRVKNMAVLAANIPLPVRPQYQQVVAQAYSTTLPGLAKAETKETQIRAARYWKKTQRSSSAFEYEQVCDHKGPKGKMRWYGCRDLDPVIKQQLLADPDQFFSGDELLKDGNTCTVVEIQAGDAAYILKRYNEKSLIYRLTHCFFLPRALLSWSNGHVLRLFGIPTPRPMACLLIQTGLLFRKGYLLMEKTSGVALDAMNEQQTSDLIPVIQEQFLHRWQELDTLSATHGDMKSGNFILSEKGVLTLIDLDSLQFHRTSGAHRKKKQKDKKRFLRNWEGFANWGPTFRAAVEAIKISS